MQKRPTLDAFLTKSDAPARNTSAVGHYDHIDAQELRAAQQCVQRGPLGQNSMPAAAEPHGAAGMATLTQGIRQLAATSSQYETYLVAPPADAAYDATPAAKLTLPVLLVVNPGALTASPTPEQLPVGKREQKCPTATLQQQCCSIPQQPQEGLQHRSTAARFVVQAAQVTESPQRQEQALQQQANHLQSIKGHQLRTKGAVLGGKDACGARLLPALRRLCKNSLNLVNLRTPGAGGTAAKAEQQDQQGVKRTIQQLHTEWQPQQQPQHETGPQKRGAKQRRVTWSPRDCTTNAAAAAAAVAAAADQHRPDVTAASFTAFFSSVLKTPAAPTAADAILLHSAVSVVSATPLTEHRPLETVLTRGPTASDTDGAGGQQARTTAAAMGHVPDMVEATPLTGPAAVHKTAQEVASAAASECVIAPTPCSVVQAVAGSAAGMKAAAIAPAAAQAAVASVAKPGQSGTAAASWGGPPPSRCSKHSAAAVDSNACTLQRELCPSSGQQLTVKQISTSWPSSRGQRERENQLELEQRRLAAAAATGSAAQAGDDAAAEGPSMVQKPAAAAAAAAAAVATVKLQHSPGPYTTHDATLDTISLAAATCGTPAVLCLQATLTPALTQHMTQLTCPGVALTGIKAANCTGTRNPTTEASRLMLGPFSLAAGTCGTPAAAVAETSLTPTTTHDLTQLTGTAAAAAVVCNEAATERCSPALDATQDLALEMISAAAATCGTPVAAAAAAQAQVMLTPLPTVDASQRHTAQQEGTMQASYAGGEQRTPVRIVTAACAASVPEETFCERPTASTSAAAVQPPAASAPTEAADAATAGQAAAATVYASPMPSTQSLCSNGLSLAAVQGTAPAEIQHAVGALTHNDNPGSASQTGKQQQQQQQQSQVHRHVPHHAIMCSDQSQQKNQAVGLTREWSPASSGQQQPAASQQPVGDAGAPTAVLCTLDQQQRRQQEPVLHQTASDADTEMPAVSMQPQGLLQPVCLATTAAQNSGFVTQHQQLQHTGQQRRSISCASPVFSLAFIEAALQYAEQLQKEPMVACSHWKGPRPAQQQQQVQQEQALPQQEIQAQQACQKQGRYHQRQHQHRTALHNEQQQQQQLPPLPWVVVPHPQGADNLQLVQPPRTTQRQQQQKQLALQQGPEQMQDLQPCQQPHSRPEAQPRLQQHQQLESLQQNIQQGIQPSSGQLLQMQCTPQQQPHDLLRHQLPKRRNSLDALSCLQHLDLSQLLTQIPRTPGIPVHVSQTQTPLDVTPEVAELSFHDRGAEPYVLVCETFPFQKDAVAFAAWCNAAGPAAVAALQRECRARNFKSFAERQQFLQQLMQQLGPQQQQQQAGARQMDAVVRASSSDQCLAAATAIGATSTGPTACSSAAAAAAVPACDTEPSAAKAPVPDAGATVASTLDYSSNGSTSWELPWVRVFTEEYEGRHGYTRRFLAASYSALWRRHINTPVGRRHFYEVIQAGCPCHLYFDLEYNTAANPGVCGDELVNVLVRLVRQEFQHQWGIDIHKQWVVELDSSTSEKFSRHLIVRVPGWAFRDNTQVGALVRLITSRTESVQQLFLQKEPKQHQQPGALMAGTSTGVRVCFVDSAVYTKNRHFRLLGSSKGGKRAVLQPTLRYAMSAASRNALPVRPHQLFLMSLICNVHPGNRFLDVVPPLPPALATRGQQQQHGAALTAAAAGADDEMLVQYPARPGAGPIVLGSEAPAGQAAAYRTIKVSWGPIAQQQQQQHQLPGDAVVIAGNADMGGNGSGFLDRCVLQDVVLSSVGFLEEEATRRAGGAAAQVRTIAYCGSTAPCHRHAAFAFSLIGPGSHMCANVGRPHKRNHVFFMVDFANGTFTQKCHDPDCWGYKSPWQRLPPYVWQKERLFGPGS